MKCCNEIKVASARTLQTFNSRVAELQICMTFLAFLRISLSLLADFASIFHHFPCVFFIWRQFYTQISQILVFWRQNCENSLCRMGPKWADLRWYGVRSYFCYSWRGNTLQKSGEQTSSGHLRLKTHWLWGDLEAVSSSKQRAFKVEWLIKSLLTYSSLSGFKTQANEASDAVVLLMSETNWTSVDTKSQIIEQRTWPFGLPRKLRCVLGAVHYRNRRSCSQWLFIVGSEGIGCNCRFRVSLNNMVIVFFQTCSSLVKNAFGAWTPPSVSGKLKTHTRHEMVKL